MKLFAKMLAACLLLCFTAFAGTAEIALEKNEGSAARVLCQSDGGFRNETGNFTARNRYTSSEIDRIQALVGQFTIQSVAETAVGADAEASEPGFDPEACFERWGMDVNKIRERELSLRFNGYDARLITEYVRASMAESSDEEVRRRAEDLPEMLNPACTAVP